MQIFLPHFEKDLVQNNDLNYTIFYFISIFILSNPFQLNLALNKKKF